MTRSVILIGPLALLAAAAGAQPAFQTIQDDPWCRNAGHDSGQATWCEVREATLPAAATPIDVDASPNGGAAATGSDRSDIRLRVRVVATADTEAEARDLAAKVSVATSPRIRANGPATGHHAHWSASFDLAVPRRSHLQLSSVNGPVAITGIDGHAVLDTQNGPLAVSGSGGQVRGRTQNGPVTATLAGTAWAGEGLDLETTNGPVTVGVPENYNARLEARTVNGPIKVSIPLTPEQESRHEIKATLGKGGALVRVRTTNGPLRVRRP